VTDAAFRNPGLAAVLSLVLPGVGQNYWHVRNDSMRVATSLRARSAGRDNGAAGPLNGTTSQ